MSRSASREALREQLGGAGAYVSDLLDSNDDHSSSGSSTQAPGTPKAPTTPVVPEADSQVNEPVVPSFADILKKSNLHPDNDGWKTEHRRAHSLPSEIKVPTFNRFYVK